MMRVPEAGLIFYTDPTTGLMYARAEDPIGRYLMDLQELADDEKRRADVEAAAAAAAAADAADRDKRFKEGMGVLPSGILTAAATAPGAINAAYAEMAAANGEPVAASPIMSNALRFGIVAFGIWLLIEAM